MENVSSDKNVYFQVKLSNLKIFNGFDFGISKIKLGFLIPNQRSPFQVFTAISYVKNGPGAKPT